MSEVFKVDERWADFRVTVPSRSLLLVKEKENWHLTTQQPAGIKIPVPPELAEQMAAVFLHTHNEEDWIDRHSWQFHWWRFWYRRKKRRDARLQQRAIIKS